MQGLWDFRIFVISLHFNRKIENMNKCNGIKILFHALSKTENDFLDYLRVHGKYWAKIRTKFIK